MTSQPKFLFDECLSEPAVRAMAATLALSPYAGIVDHLFTKFSTGALDPDWIPAIAGDGWIVVTSDRGVNSKADESLPLICAAYGVTHVIFSAGMTKRTVHFRLTAFQSLWPELVQIASATPGSHYSLRLSSSTQQPKLVLIGSPEQNQPIKSQKDLGF